MTQVTKTMSALLLAAALVFGQSVARMDTGSLTASSQAVTTPITSDTAAVAIQITGTFVGTVTFEASVDGTNYVATAVVPVTTAGTRVTTATATGLFYMNVAGMKSVRARCSAYTSGTIVISINRSRATPPIGA